MRIGLALSGGGLRATLYHLGVVRYMKEAGLLSSVSHITSVSGGSVLGAHLVLNWDRYNGSDEELNGACREIIDFVRLDVRNRIVRRYPFTLAFGSLQRLFRQRPSRRVTRTGLLEKQYQDFLFGDTCLHELPIKPELHVLCTNLSEGGLSSFSRSGLLFEERSKSGHTQMRRQRAGLATVPMAVAASSAFPGFFPPLELTADDIGATEGEFQTQYFTDGGVYDNLGVRMFRWLERQQEAKLRSEDFACVESAVRVWNEAAGSDCRTALHRIAQIYSGSQHDHSHTPTRSPVVKESQELLSGLEHLISETNLAKDPELRSLMELDRYGGNGHGDGSFHSNGNGSGHVDRIALLASNDRLARNRRMLSLAFREAAGQDFLSEPQVGFDAIIASDAGKKFQVTRPDRAGSFLRTAMRSSDILMDRVWQLEKEHFAKSTDYVFAPITRIVTPEEDGTAMHPEVQIQISKVRTDMDRFTDDESSGLVRHGYCVARQSIAARPGLQSYTHDGSPWDPTCEVENESSQTAKKEASRRGAQATDATKQARRLQHSSRRKYLGQFFSARDWVSYMYVPILFLLLGIAPFMLYRSWRHGAVASTLTAAMAETRDDYKTLLNLMEDGPVDAWSPMPFVEADHFDPLFAEQGLDIIADVRIIDLRQFEGTAHASDPSVYFYRSVSVRKVHQSDGATGLRLQSQWDMPQIVARCRNPGLHPELHRCAVPATDDSEKSYAWQLDLDFSSVPVGHTTNVIVEALLPAHDREISGHGLPWWEFEVDADPEVATSWLLLPEDWKESNAQLVRFQNETPESLEVVEPTHHASMLGDSILHWIVVHPKAGYTYTYRWNANK
ncbi:MAG: patatin-like phospholipase family protein [Rubripirellula sp.]